MSTTPVSQATFDAALATFNTAFSTLAADQVSIIQGLANVEAALLAAQANPGSSDFTGELATVQNLQAEVTSSLTAAQAAIAGIPAADAPAAATASAQLKAEVKPEEKKA